MKLFIAFTILVGTLAGAVRLTQRVSTPTLNALPKSDKPIESTADQAPAQTKRPISDPEAYRRDSERSKIADDLFQSAQRAYYAGRTEDAERLARRSIDDGSSSIATRDSRKLIGRILMDKGEYRDAAEMLAKDWVRGQDSVGDLDIALCYAKLGRFDLAERFYNDESILQYHGASAEDLPDATTPKGAEARILIARGLEASTRLSGKYDAQKAFAQAARLAPRNTLVAQMMSRSLLRDERDDEALPYLATIVVYGKGERKREADARFSTYVRAVREKALAEAKTGR